MQAIKKIPYQMRWNLERLNWCKVFPNENKLLKIQWNNGMSTKEITIVGGTAIAINLVLEQQEISDKDGIPLGRLLEILCPTCLPEAQKP